MKLSKSEPKPPTFLTKTRRQTTAFIIVRNADGRIKEGEYL